MESTVKNITGVSQDLFENNLSLMPEWLKDNKKSAWESFNSLSANKTRREKFSNIIESMELDTLKAENTFSVPGEEFEKLWGDLSAEYILNNTDTFVSEELSKKGVILKSLKAALTENEELVKPYLTKSKITSKDSRFTSLAEAMWTDGVFLYVPKDLDIELPVHLLKWIKEGKSQNYYKTLVIVEAGSKLLLLDEYASSENSGEFFMVNGVNEIHIKDNAKVTYMHLQNLDYNAFNFSLQKMFLGKGSTLKTLTVSMGSQFSYENIRSYMESPDGNTELLGVVLGDREQVFQHETLQYHPKPASNSNLHFEIMVNDHSESAFNGYVEIEKQADQTNAHQLCRNMVLSKNAKSEAIPNLEILADDVKCSHGVTIGPVNPEELFYIMSRGFTQDEAENFIIQGTIENVVKEIESEVLSEKVHEYVLNNLKKRGVK